MSDLSRVAYVSMFSPHLQAYALNMRECGGPYDLFWAEAKDPRERRSELGLETLEAAAVRALEISAREAHRGEVLAFSGDTWVWRVYHKSNGQGSIVGKAGSSPYAQHQARSVAGKLKRVAVPASSGMAVPVDAWLTLTYKPTPTSPYLSAEYEGIVRALHAARTIAEKHAASHRVTVYIADSTGVRRFAVVAELNQSTVVRAVFPNRGARKPILEQLQARAARVTRAHRGAPDPEPKTEQSGVRDFIETDEPSLRYTYDGEDEDEDDEPEQALEPMQPLDELIAAPEDDELPAPPFRPGQTHFLFTRAGQDLIDNGMRNGTYVGQAAHKAALRISPDMEERRRHRDLYPDLDTYPWDADGEIAP